jgi:hypothetical protein
MNYSRLRDFLLTNDDSARIISYFVLRARRAGRRRRPEPSDELVAVDEIRCRRRRRITSRTIGRRRSRAVSGRRGRRGPSRHSQRVRLSRELASARPLATAKPYKSMNGLQGSSLGRPSRADKRRRQRSKERDWRRLSGLWRPRAQAARRRKFVPQPARSIRSARKRSWPSLAPGGGGKRWPR